MMGHLWASCWDRLLPSFHARIIRRNKHQKPTSGSVSWLELARKHRTFPLTSIGATRVACLREHRRRPPTLLRVAASCRQIARLARARRLAQRQPFDSMLLHNERRHSSFPNPTNSIRISRDSFVGCIKHRNGEFALYRWKLAQKFIKALAAFQVIEKGADWNTSTDKHQAAAEDIGVAVRNIGKCSHGTSLYSVVSISLVGSGT
jgi:hypothetical protein